MRGSFSMAKKFGAGSKRSTPPIAPARLSATKQHWQRRALDKSPSDSAMTFEQAAGPRIKRLDGKVSIKRGPLGNSTSA